jgi:hypothetical protein
MHVWGWHVGPKYPTLHWLHVLADVQCAWLLLSQFAMHVSANNMSINQKRIHAQRTWLTCRVKVTNVALAASAVRYTVGLARAVAVCNAQMGLTCRAKVSSIALAACAGGRAMSLTAAVTVLDARVCKTLALALKARHLQTWLTC